MLTNWSAAAASAVNHQQSCSVHMARPHTAVPVSAVLWPVLFPLLWAAPAATSLVLPGQSELLRKGTKNHSRDAFFFLRLMLQQEGGGKTGGVSQQLGRWAQAAFLHSSKRAVWTEHHGLVSYNLDFEHQSQSLRLVFWTNHIPDFGHWL